MNINTVKLVALQEMKQIRRNWLFIFFVFLVMTGMLFLQIILQTSHVMYNLRALPCSIPYLNALLYNFLQCLFVIFVSGDLVQREVRKDTIAAIQTRAYENKEYLFGKVIWNRVLVFLSKHYRGLCCFCFPNDYETNLFYILSLYFLPVHVNIPDLAVYYRFVFAGTWCC